MPKLASLLDLSDSEVAELDALSNPFRVTADRANGLDRKWLATQPAELQAGWLLRGFRVRRHKIQKEFARNLDITHSLLSQWENGITPIPPARIDAIQGNLALNNDEVAELKALTELCVAFHKNKRVEMKAVSSVQVGGAFSVAEAAKRSLILEPRKAKAR